MSKQKAAFQRRSYFVKILPKMLFLSLINFKIRDKIYRLIHGNGWVLVYPPALKPVWEVRSCLGGFDSHTFPPFEPNFRFFFFVLDGRLPCKKSPFLL